MRKTKKDSLISEDNSHVNYKRVSYCGECLRPIAGHWLRPVHADDRTPICVARPARVYEGTPLVFEVDFRTARAIDASGLDPRRHEYWETVAAADGNKGYKKWRGKK